MAQVPDWKRFLDAGVQFTNVTREQAERLVEDLVREGELAQDRAETYVDEIVARSRKWSDDLQGRIRDEIQNQLRSVGLATQEDIRRLEGKIRPTKGKPAKKAKKAKKAPKKSAKKAPKRAPNAPATSAEVARLRKEVQALRRDIKAMRKMLEQMAKGGGR